MITCGISLAAKQHMTTLKNKVQAHPTHITPTSHCTIMYILLLPIRNQLERGLPVTAMSNRAPARPRQEGIMVHLRPSLSATKDAGITPTKLTTAIAANSRPARAWTASRSQFCYTAVLLHVLLSLPATKDGRTAPSEQSIVMAVNSLSHLCRGIISNSNPARSSSAAQSHICT